MIATIGELLGPGSVGGPAGDREGRASGGTAAIVTVLLVGAGTYGAVLGAWRGGWMIAAAAVKLPLVLLATAALTTPLGWLVAVLGGVRISARAAWRLSILALARAAVVLASLAPIAWLFTRAAPAPGLEARTAHNVLYLMHTALVALAGVAGTVGMHGGLAERARDRRLALRITRAWILAFALVGGEVAWALRPFVGSIYLPVTFLRPDALDGNVYELVWTDILPHLLAR